MLLFFFKLYSIFDIKNVSPPNDNTMIIESNNDESIESSDETNLKPGPKILYCFALKNIILSITKQIEHFW